MKYSIQRLIDIILFFAEHTDPKRFGVTKLAGLIFWADFLYYMKYKDVISGDQYRKTGYDLIPDSSYKIFKKTFLLDVIMEKTGLEEAIKIAPEMIGDYIFLRIVPLKKANSSAFSKQEAEIMTEVGQKYYSTQGKRLSREIQKIPSSAIKKFVGHLLSLKNNIR